MLFQVESTVIILFQHQRLKAGRFQAGVKPAPGPHLEADAVELLKAERASVDKLRGVRSAG